MNRYDKGESEEPAWRLFPRVVLAAPDGNRLPSALPGLRRPALSLGGPAGVNEPTRVFQAAADMPLGCVEQ